MQTQKTGEERERRKEGHPSMPPSPSLQKSIEPLSREKHIPGCFLNTAREVKPGAQIAAMVAPCHTFEQQGAGE